MLIKNRNRQLQDDDVKGQTQDRRTEDATNKPSLSTQLPSTTISAAINLIDSNIAIHLSPSGAMTVIEDVSSNSTTLSQSVYAVTELNQQTQLQSSYPTNTLSIAPGGLATTDTREVDYTSQKMEDLCIQGPLHNIKPIPTTTISSKKYHHHHHHTASQSNFRTLSPHIPLRYLNPLAALIDFRNKYHFCPYVHQRFCGSRAWFEVGNLFIFFYSFTDEDYYS
jgi:hypothetical protein